MMNLISFETPPLGRQDGVTTTIVKAKEAAASSSGACFHSSHLDLSLGISLSHGGGGDAAAKVSSYGSGGGGGCMGGGGGCMGGGGGCMGGGGVLTAAASELSVGHGQSQDIVSGGSWTAAFMPSPIGFVHPWSLAARQQKAAAEQDRRSIGRPAAPTYLPSPAPTVVSLPAAVGWPPVHTTRRNLVTAAMNVLKPNVAKPDRRKDDAEIAGDDDDDEEKKNPAVAPRNRPTTAAAEARPSPANMFAKVHMDGYLIGRKINLRAHRSYNSLRRVLAKMTHNFFCPADYSSTNVGEEDCAKSEEFIFLYEDFEGDRMLVGDVPWELFLASAKRLYIAKNPAPRNKDHDETAKIQAEEATDN